MIGEISRGADTAGLLRYLLGPGRANEHTHPHLVASWDGDPGTFGPVVVEGRPRVRGLAALLDQPLDALQRRPGSPVWHCSLRNAPGDRHLSDQEWAEVARRVLDRAGLAPAGGGDGCRWVAVRHAEDHIHLLVTLAHQDGRPARTSHDYRRVGAACQELETELGLTGTRARDSTAVRRPTRVEEENADRSGRREATRETLRREVRVASIAALDPQTFLRELQRNGLLVKPRHSSQDPGQLTGYSVAWPGDHAAGARPVWFSGSTLAPDLSLPRLKRRWEGVRHEVERAHDPTSGAQHGRSGWTSMAAAVAAVAGAAPASRDVTGLLDAAAWALVAVARATEGPPGGRMTSTATGLVDALGRPAPGRKRVSASERQLLAAAHLVLRSSAGTRTVGVEAARTGRLFGELITALAQVSGRGSPLPSRRGRGAGAFALPGSESSTVLLPAPTPQSVPRRAAHAEVLARRVEVRDRPGGTTRGR